MPSVVTSSIMGRHRRLPDMTVVGRLYHVGIVVPDIEVAKAHLGELLGITWGPVLHVDEYDVS